MQSGAPLLWCLSKPLSVVIGFLPLRRTASRPHHPECRPGDCDEARHHPRVRQARGPAGQGGQRLHLLRASRQVAQERREGIKGRHSKCNCPMEYIHFIL